MSASCWTNRAVEDQTSHRRKTERPAPPTLATGVAVASPTRFESRMLSVSRTAREHLAEGPYLCRELARFRRAVNLEVMPATLSSEHPSEIPPAILSLVEPEVGNGPFHIVVTSLPPVLPAPVPALWQGEVLRIGPWMLVAGPDTPIWEPAPQWSAQTISEIQLGKLTVKLDADTLLGQRGTPVTRATAEALTAGLTGLLQALDGGDDTAMRAAAAGLGGLGPGLTPAGDDVLAGVMLALYAVHHPRAAQLASAIYAAAAPHTTALSRAFLAAASRGKTTEAWHRLLAALSHEHAPDLDVAVDGVLGFGATSGPSMLWGFVATCHGAV